MQYHVSKSFQKIQDTALPTFGIFATFIVFFPSTSQPNIASQRPNQYSDPYQRQAAADPKPGYGYGTSGQTAASASQYPSAANQYSTQQASGYSRGGGGAYAASASIPQAQTTSAGYGYATQSGYSPPTPVGQRSAQGQYGAGGAPGIGLQSAQAPVAGYGYGAKAVSQDPYGRAGYAAQAASSNTRGPIQQSAYAGGQGMIPQQQRDTRYAAGNLRY